MAYKYQNISKSYDTNGELLRTVTIDDIISDSNFLSQFLNNNGTSKTIYIPYVLTESKRTQTIIGRNHITNNTNIYAVYPFSAFKSDIINVVVGNDYETAIRNIVNDKHIVFVKKNVL